HGAGRLPQISFEGVAKHLALPSFPTRRSSDLTPADFSATTIDWGDGSTQTAAAANVTITQLGTLFTVTGSHTYTDESTPTVGVTSKDHTAELPYPTNTVSRIHPPQATAAPSTH